ncbi:MAG TPA: hypothetical protein VH373_15100 [Jatrophihabitantaceae bacterium]
MTELAIRVLADEPVDEQRLDEQTRVLADDLRAIGGLAVRPAVAAAQSASKAGATESIGYLIVSGLLSASTVGAIRDVIVAYLARSRGRRIDVQVGDKQVSIEGASASDLSSLTKQLTELVSGPGRDE